MSTWTSHLSAFTGGIDDATDAGLKAAAQVVQNAVKRGLRGGYTTGEYVTGTVINSVTRSDPVTEDGVRVIRVGTNLDYALFWELGWMPHMTHAGPRQLLRKEIWLPAMIDTREAQRAAFVRAFERRLGTWVARPASAGLGGTSFEPRLESPPDPAAEA